jgi:hypothetical protein
VHNESSKYLIGGVLVLLVIVAIIGELRSPSTTDGATTSAPTPAATSKASPPATPTITPAPPAITPAAISVLPECSVALKLPTKPTCQFVNSLGETKIWTHEDAVHADEEFNELPKKERDAVIKAEKETAKQESAEAAQRAAYPNATLVGYTEREALGVVKLQQTLLDPDSLRFDEVFVAYDGTVCFSYRARNGFGGYGVGHAVLISKTESLSNDADTYNKYCAGKFGWDDSKILKNQYNK